MTMDIYIYIIYNRYYIIYITVIFIYLFILFIYIYIYTWIIDLQPTNWRLVYWVLYNCRAQMR